MQAFSDQQPTLTLLRGARGQQLTRLGSRRPGIQSKALGQTDAVRIAIAGAFTAVMLP